MKNKTIEDSYITKYRELVSLVEEMIFNLNKGLKKISNFKIELFEYFKTKIKKEHGKFYNLGERNKKIKKLEGINKNVIKYKKIFSDYLYLSFNNYDRNLFKRDRLKKKKITIELEMFKNFEKNIKSELSKREKYYFNNSINTVEDIVRKIPVNVNNIFLKYNKIKIINKIKKKIPKKTKSDVEKYIDELFQFFRKNKIQTKIEYISESLFLKFGFSSSNLYKIENVRSRITTLRKKIRGLDNKKNADQNIPNRFFGGEEYLKIIIRESDGNCTYVYYSKEKIKKFHEMTKKKTSFFVDGTRKLISTGLDRRQLVTISSKINGKGFNLVYIISTPQTSNHYKKCLKRIGEETKIFEKCNFILIDMEIAFAKAFQEMKIPTKFCYFHVASRMIKWKSRNDKKSTNYNYIRPELIRMAQKIIFIPEEKLGFFFTILIWLFVEKEKDLYRKKNAVKFINYISDLYTRRLKKYRYHKVESKDITNNIAESFHSKLKKRIGYVKNLQFVVDACLVNDFEQMSQIGRERRETTTNSFWNRVYYFQSRNYTHGSLLGFLMYNLEGSKKIKHYNLKKMISTFNEEDFKFLHNKQSHFSKNSFIDDKALEFGVQFILKGGKLYLDDKNMLFVKNLKNKSAMSDTNYEDSEPEDYYNGVENLSFDERREISTPEIFVIEK